MTHNRRSIVVAAMTSTREQLRSEISFRDKVIRLSSPKGANRKVERIVAFHGRYGLCPRRFGPSSTPKDPRCRNCIVTWQFLVHCTPKTSALAWIGIYGTSTRSESPVRSQRVKRHIDGTRFGSPECR